ncbi:Transcription factor FapR [Anoxybacillus sp. BCO1]|nr:Transcription factor FapR [Anoxybacillus sp. BCO1]
MRERIKHVAERTFADEVKSLPIEEVIGEIIDIQLDESAISIFDVKKEHVFQRNQIARGHHLFAQANSLAVAVINDELALTAKAHIRFMRPVKEGERVVAKAKVTNLNENGRTVVEVNSYVGQELVFQGEFHMYRSNVVKKDGEEKMKIAIDAMGGDHAPKEVVIGAQKAIEHFHDIEITLVGNETLIRPYITNDERLSIIHTEQVIEATDERSCRSP